MSGNKQKMKLKVGDNVVVISGQDKGSVGEILKIDRKLQRVFVKDANMQVKHEKPKQQDQKGKIIRKEGPIHYSNVLLFNSSTSKGERIGYKFNSDGAKIRIFRKSNQEA